MSRRFDHLLPHWLALPPRVRRQLRAHHSTPPKDRTLARLEVLLICGFARAGPRYSDAQLHRSRPHVACGVHQRPRERDGCLHAVGRANCSSSGDRRQRGRFPHPARRRGEATRRIIRGRDAGRESRPRQRLRVPIARTEAAGDPNDHVRHWLRHQAVHVQLRTCCSSRRASCQ